MLKTPTLYNAFGGIGRRTELLRSLATQVVQVLLAVITF